MQPVIVKKVMTLTFDEFAAGLKNLSAGRITQRGEYVADLDGGMVRVTFGKLPGVRLGRLLELPRATITIAFEDVSDEFRAAFLKRFDLAFQRGGG